MDETIEGEISLKRQFIIRQSKIKGMFDTGVTIGDSLLQAALGNNASTTMKSIVATIQREQNKIIRNEHSKLLIVQGVAGSGKTSAVLQRIAYLLYRFRGSLNSENLLLFSPNPLFSSYIANVLPELGETNISQTTFYDFLRDGIEKDITIESPFEQMECMLTDNDTKELAIRKVNMKLKSSIEYKTIIDEYLSSLTSKGIQFRNITFRGDILISKESIADYFYSLDESISIPNKMELVAKWLLQEIKIHQQKEKSKDWVLEQIELLDKEEYLQAYYENQRVDEDDPSIEEDILRAIVVKKQFAGVKKQIKKYAFVNTLTTYQQLFMNWTTSSLPNNWDKIKQLTMQHLTNKHLTWEDATPYRYFRGKLLGDKENRAIRHLFIDEAQDYSAFQFTYMKEIFPYTRMTLLGDINQAIYTYASTENPLVPEYISENHERIVLTKSYRSTKQIVEFTKKFAPGGDMIEPFERDGEPPQIIENQGDVSTTLKQLIQDLKAKDYETIAVICKTLEESNELYEMLKDKVSLKQIKEDTYSFEKGIVVVPVYLAKGIEFDAVIIPDASKEHYDQESDRTLFYTACTRAMHSLTLLTKGTPCIFLQEALN